MHKLGTWIGGCSLLAAALATAGCSSDEGKSSTPLGNAGTGNSAGTSGNSGGGSTGQAGTATSGGAGAGGAPSSGDCSAPPTVADQPLLLSATGCIEMTDPSKPAPGLVPYSVNSPLWSDGASKERFVKVPAGMKIHALDCDVDTAECAAPAEGGSGADEGHWGMPVGTVLVKNFSIDGARIETRLLIRMAETTWKGFSYEWNDAGTEANLLADEKDKPVGSQTWHYPSPSQCLECHTKAGGRSLGPTTAQMDLDYDYADGTMNQIEKFASLGLFDATPKAIPAYPPPSGTASVEERARSYLQTNCAICHRPGGPLSDVDFRFITAFADMKLCNVPIERGTGDPLLPQVRLVPGMPGDSSLSFRMHDTTDYRMPKVGSTVVDTDGTALIDEWITGITTCP